MTGYGINDFRLVALLAICISVIPLVGFWVSMIRRLSVARFFGWTLVVGAVFFVDRASAGEPSGTRMLLIIVALLWSMKAVVYVETRQRGKCDLTFWQWLGFCVGWFGMRADLFRRPRDTPLADWREYIRRGLVYGVIGGVLIASASTVAHVGLDGTTAIKSWRLLAATALLLSGISLVVHFGFFNLLTGFWRYFGVPCSTLFRAPWLSRSLSEFWGRRWNLAYSEMTALAVFRPLKQLPGRPHRVAILATSGGFLFSGLLHELAISVPVGTGFGLPMLYFAIHGIGVGLEKRLTCLRSVRAGRTWTAAWVLLPLPILFHRPFLEGCVWPIIGI